MEIRVCCCTAGRCLGERRGGGEYVAVQKTPSSDLAIFVNTAGDGMLPSPGDLRNIRDETFPVSQDESGDKANLRNRLSIQSPTDEENPGPREPPDDLRTLLIGYDAHGTQSLAGFHSRGNF